MSNCDKYNGDDVFGFAVLLAVVLAAGLFVGGLIGWGSGYNAARADIYQKASGMVNKEK